MNLAQAKAIIEADDRIVEVMSDANEAAWQSLIKWAKSMVSADLKHKAKMARKSAPLRSVIVREQP